MKTLIFISILFLYSCTTVKEVTKTVSVVDSSAIKTRDSLLSVVNQMIVTHNQELRELRNTGIIFDNDCDTIFLDQLIGCNIDSLIKIIRSQKNKIKILADGSIEAEGKIKSVRSNMEKTEKQTDQLLFLNTKLLRVRDSLAYELSKKDTAQVKNVKRGWWSWWFLFFFILGNISMLLFLKWWHKRLTITH